MKKTIILAATLGLALAVSPAVAQNVSQVQAEHARQVRARAQQLATTRIDPRRLGPIYIGNQQIDARQDPWVPVTDSAMNQTNVDPYTRKARYSLQVSVDYNGDGHADTAYIANNSRQAAVIVNLGGPRRQSLVIFKQDGRFMGGEEIFAAGRSRILVNVPDVAQHLLLMEGGQPKVVSYGE